MTASTTIRPMDTSGSLPTVGLVGLGNLGRPMALSLLASGHPLVVTSLSRHEADDLVARGATWADSAAELAERVDVLITVLPGPAQVRCGGLRIPDQPRLAGPTGVAAIAAVVDEQHDEPLVGERLRDVDSPGAVARVAGQVPHVGGGETNPEGLFNPDAFLSPKEQRKIDTFILYAIAAAQEAIQDSGWTPATDEDRERTGV